MTVPVSRLDRYFKLGWSLLAITVLVAMVLLVAREIRGIVLLLGLTVFTTYLLLGPVNWTEWLIRQGLRRSPHPRSLEGSIHLLPRFLVRGVSILLVYLVFGLSVLVFSVRFLPQAFEQLYAFSTEVPRYVHQTEEWLLNQPLAQSFFHQEVRFLLSQGVISLPESETRMIESHPQSQPLSPVEKRVIREKVFVSPHQVNQLVRDHLAEAFENVFALVSQTLTGFVYALTGLVLVFYFLLDAARLKSGFVRLLPTWQQPGLNRFLESFHNVMFGYTKAHLILGGLTGLYLGVLNTAIGLPFGVFLAMFFAVAQIIPVVGPWIGIIPWLLLGQQATPAQMILSLVGLGLFQLVKDVWLAPRVMGQALDLHPVIVILSLLVCARVAGVESILFAIPLASMVNVSIRLLQHPAGMLEEAA